MEDQAVLEKVQHERRNAAARSARDSLGSLLAIEPRHLASLDPATASAIAHSIRMAGGLVNEGPRPRGRLSATARRLFGPRYLRLQRAVRRSRFSGQGWRIAAFAQFVVLMAIAGSMVGSRFAQPVVPAPRAHVATSAQAPAPAPSAAPPATPAATAAASPLPAGPIAEGVHALETKTGLRYSDAPCTPDKPCLTAAKGTPGDVAAYTEVTAVGYPGGSTCYSYLHQVASSWSPDVQSCGFRAGFAPAVDVTMPVRAPGTCARLHRAPGLASPIVACLLDGTQVTIVSPPTYREGRFWWSVVAGSRSGLIAMDALAVG